MYKLVVSDFDGTLLDDDEAIPISTVLTIDQIRRKNCKFAIATGRGINFVKEYIKDVNFIDYIIALNGSYVYDVLRDCLIFEKSIKKGTVKKIVNKYKNKNTKIYLCTDHSKCLLTRDENISDEIIIHDIADFIKNNKVYKIEIHTKTNKLSKEILKEIKALDLDLNLNFQTYENKDYLIEMTTSNISKYSATTLIAKKEKIKNDEIVAFGDSYNDLELIKKVGYGISMENAIKEVKKVSKETTLSNNNKGVEKSLLTIFY